MQNWQTAKSYVARMGETEFLPSYTFYEIHRSKPIPTEPADIIEAVAALDMHDDKITHIMISLRDLPGRLSAKILKSPKITPIPQFGFNSFTPLRRNDHELSMGLIGRFWNPVMDIRKIANATDFQAYDVPTDAKLVLRFLVVESDGQSPCLVTETFIHCPTRRTKLLFTPYWLVIRLVSGWLRKRTLTSLRRKLIASQ